MRECPGPARRAEVVLVLNPRSAPAANNLAWLLSEHGGDKDKTLTLAQTAKELAPENPRVSDTLGWIFYRRGLHQRALALLKDSAGKLPCNTMIQYHLGRVSAQLGDTEAARQALSISVTPRPCAAPLPGPPHPRLARPVRPLIPGAAELRRTPTSSVSPAWRRGGRPPPTSGAGEV